MKKSYADLEKRETTLKRNLSDTYSAHSADIRDITTAAFNAAAVDGKASVTKLHARISKAEAAQIKRDATEAAALFEGQNPFTTDNFDQLNRMDAMQTRITVSNLKTAATIRDKVKKHLSDYIEDIITMYWQYFEIIRSDDLAALVNSIVDNPAHPISDTVYNNAMTAATRITDIVKHDMIRGTSADKAADDAADYILRKDTNDTNSLIYTEGTRATVTAATEALKKDITHFYSVIMADDACELCKEIAETQEAEPVPIEEFICGDTAPPFHPFCRCSVEYVWSDPLSEGDNDD